MILDPTTNLIPPTPVITCVHIHLCMILDTTLFLTTIQHGLVHIHLCMILDEIWTIGLEMGLVSSHPSLYDFRLKEGDGMNEDYSLFTSISV